MLNIKVVVKVDVSNEGKRKIRQKEHPNTLVFPG
jgi:hypothetical protein